MDILRGSILVGLILVAGVIFGYKLRKVQKQETSEASSTEYPKDSVAAILLRNWFCILGAITSIAIAVYYFNLPNENASAFWRISKEGLIIPDAILYFVYALGPILLELVLRGKLDPKNIRYMRLMMIAGLISALLLQFFSLRHFYLNAGPQPNITCTWYGLGFIIYGNYLPKWNVNQGTKLKYPEAVLKKLNKYVGKIFFGLGAYCLFMAIPSFLFVIKSNLYFWLTLAAPIFLCCVFWYFIPRKRNQLIAEYERMEGGK